MSTARQRKLWREANARWRAKNPRHATQYYKKHKKTVARNQKRRLAKDNTNHKLLMQKYHRLHRERLLTGAGTHCPICMRYLVTPYADHCYATARRICKHVVYKACLRCRRDVICPSCNSMLGLVKESVKTLERAKQYILRWKKILGRRKRG